MNNRIDTVNGKEVTEFKKNTDYFEMSDGVFWTIKALAIKYSTAENTIYKKAKDYNIATMKVLGITCFKDDKRFEKRTMGGNPENLKGRSLMSYAELHRKVEELIKIVRSATIPNDENNIKIEYLVKIEARVVHIEQEIERLKDIMNKILDYVTQPEVVEVEKNK